MAAADGFVWGLSRRQVEGLLPWLLPDKLSCFLARHVYSHSQALFLGRLETFCGEPPRVSAGTMMMRFSDKGRGEEKSSLMSKVFGGWWVAARALLRKPASWGLSKCQDAL